MKSQSMIERSQTMHAERGTPLVGRPNTPLYGKKLKKVWRIFQYQYEYAFHKNSRRPQTPSGSLINGLPFRFMEILKVPAASSRTCNDTLLGALLASASDSEGVPQPVHARARPPSAPCGTQEPPLVAQVMQNGYCWASNAL